jgi:hypothetical protein
MPVTLAPVGQPMDGGKRPLENASVHRCAQVVNAIGFPLRGVTAEPDIVTER